jgi:hypothetical protein
MIVRISSMWSVARGSTKRGRAVGQGADRDAALEGAAVDLVVHVRDVARIGDRLGPIGLAQQAEQEVEHDDRPRIADMGEVVDGRAADIEAHVRGIDRDEDVLRPGQRVVEPDGPGHETDDPRLAAGRRVVSIREIRTRRLQPAVR